MHRAIRLDASGRFDVEGEYNVDAYPVDLGILHPARFIGVVEGRILILTVVLTDTLLSLGPVSLVYDREPVMSVCPICRPADARGKSVAGLLRLVGPGIRAIVPAGARGHPRLWPQRRRNC